MNSNELLNSKFKEEYFKGYKQSLFNINLILLKKSF